ncbi:exodeoxyribonuclease VII small subunit [Nocardioides marmoribigeumensis]|uniref:Exodeoxyribonuclease 7 small subunit n=1 Tax=Nocardioides marmoribigeumensis TaxID=433649 RepID=A0ABU2BX95_9ACTN|nr:exodeoxyribonuclease VII small subunit [Nocardioides marmoribigeumensis]MDR7363020.1 exodeoxyribonuclease VII small subunit [Nocardioides marmoribigeumensis]
MSTPPTTTGDKDLSYEDARAQLLEVVRTLEQGGATLEESIALWERGERLAEVCQQWLDGARERLEAVLAGAADED